MFLTSPWRTGFPGIQALAAEDQTYLDSADTAQKPQAMLDALLCDYAGDAANVHRAQHLPDQRATRAFEATREKAEQWLHAPDAQQIIFTRSATEAFNLLAYGLEQTFEAGDAMVISAREHHANLLPWRQLALRRQLKLVILPLDSKGLIDLSLAAQLIGSRTRLLAVSQLSNVLGCWQPFEPVLALAQAQVALTLVDGTQGVVHGCHDLQALGCDFYICSSHKLYGPDGVGLLYGRPQGLQQLAHWQFNSEMLLRTDYADTTLRPAPLGFEAGTPPIALVIALGASLDYLRNLDASAVSDHEAALHAVLLAELQQRQGVRLLGAPNVAMASVVVDGVHHADLANLLNEQGIAVRAGHHCAMPLLPDLGLNGPLGVSLGLDNDAGDLQRVSMALDQPLALLQ
jgi:cysteine sulfinate desulfinase